jgi:CDP-glucose 4,6-dehydratase
MESLEMTSLFGGIFKDKKILVTGHTGFKGSWLIHWLDKLGAQVYGIALDPLSEPNHISVLKSKYTSRVLDITRKVELEAAIGEIRPEMIFHLAAQAIVRLSYEQPYETFLTNIMGTVNVLEAARHVDSVKAVVIITSDKCYENREWVWGYRENDPMGGKDPYSSSKGCAELITAAYRNSFFNAASYGTSHHVLIASARAGNVIGGGDWAQDRIIPDLVKAASQGSTLFLRYPNATRPWQHVLEPLSGYLMLGWRLLEGKPEFAKGWNFGPDISSNLSVIELVKEAARTWPAVRFEFENFPHLPEAGYLMLDSSMARKQLSWNTVWDFKTSIRRTIQWYKHYYEENAIQTDSDLEEFVTEANEKFLVWTDRP